MEMNKIQTKEKDYNVIDRKEGKYIVKNQYIVTEKMYQSWGRENQLKGVQLVFLVLWSFLAVCVLLLNIFGGWTALGILMLLFCLYRAFLRSYVVTRAQYKRLSQAYGTPNWTRTIDFGEEEILIHDGNASVKYAYKDIAGLREKEKRIWLDAANKTVIRLYKDCFVDTDYETWKKRMIERGGNEWKN